MFHEEHRPEVGTRLALYGELVERWSERLGLVSAGDRARWHERHVLDSLRLAPLMDEQAEGPAVDVGSGAGLPGIPLAVVRPERPWTLVEPRRRRAGFLEEVVRRLELDARVVVATAQEAARDPELRSAHVLAVARAVAPPARSFELLVPLLRPGGVAAVFVGEGARVPQQAEVWTPGVAIMRPGGQNG